MKFRKNILSLFFEFRKYHLNFMLNDAQSLMRLILCHHGTIDSLIFLDL